MAPVFGGEHGCDYEACQNKVCRDSLDTTSTGVFTLNAHSDPNSTNELSKAKSDSVTH